jgi:twitching motility protein PilT
MESVATPEVVLPSDVRNGIGSAVTHALMFARSITDIMIHEGRPIMAKSARGTKPLHELFPAIPAFDVTRHHIVHYLAGYVEGGTRHADVQAYWDERLKPILQARRSANFRLEGKLHHSLRYTLFLHGGGELGLVMRISPSRIATLAELALPPQLISALQEASSGFVAITGPSGSGKTATALSILDAHNTRHSGHIVTIEDPVENKIAPKLSFVTQREVGHDVLNFADGMREALRMSPDVMLTSEIRDAETAEQAIQGGESGCLMLATMHGRSTVGTLRKILSYTGSNAAAMRSVLAGSLVAVVRQALIPSTKGDRYHMVADVMFNQGKVTQHIESGDWSALEQAIHSENLGPSEYISMNARIVELVKRGDVEAASAMRCTSDMFELRKKLSR